LLSYFLNVINSLEDLEDKNQFDFNLSGMSESSVGKFLFIALPSVNTRVNLKIRESPL